MKLTLFFVFIAIFTATAAITLLGVVKKIRIQSKYLNVLFSALLLEVAAAVVTLFKGTDFFYEKPPPPIPPITELDGITLTNTVGEQLIGTSWVVRNSKDWYTPGEFTLVLLRNGRMVIEHKEGGFYIRPNPESTHWSFSSNQLSFDIPGQMNGNFMGPAYFSGSLTSRDKFSGKASCDREHKGDPFKWNWTAEMHKY